MTPQYYLQALARAEIEARYATGPETQALAFAGITSQIEVLSHDERRKLRQELQALGCTKLLQNLFFDYDKQVWI